MIGYVYKIISNETDKCYIGSTTKSINERFSNHKSKYKMYVNGKYHYVTSFDIIKYDDAIIVLIDEIEFEDKQELHKLEGKYIRELNCVNKIICGRTKKEYKKEYSEKNKEYIKQYDKEYRDKNKEYKKQLMKDYRDKNKEKMKEYMKKYREENTDKIKQQRKEYYEKIKNII